MPIDSNKVNNTRSSTQSNNSIQNRQFGSHSNFSMPHRLSSLSEGQILHGEITDLRNNEVTITLTDNTTIIGQISDTSNLYIGQTTSFKVTDISPRQVSLECLVNNFSNRQDITILKALDEAFMPKTERNKQLVQELLEYRMPINKQMLSQMTQQLAAIKGTSISTLVLMNKYNIPIDPEMAMQFEGYRTGDHSLLQGINNISENLPALLSVLSENGDSSDVAAFGGKLMSILSNHINNSQTDYISPDISILDAPQRNALIQYINNAASKSSGDLNTEFSAKQLSSLTAEIANGTSLLRDVSKAITYLSNTDNNSIESPDVQAEQASLETDQGSVDYLKSAINSMNSAIEYAKTNNNELTLIMNQNERNNLITIAKNLDLAPSIIDKIKEGSIPVEKVFTAIQASISDESFSSAEAAAELFSTQGFQKIFSKVIQHMWTLSPRDIRHNGQIQDYYSKLVNDLIDTAKLIESNLSGTDSETLSGQANTLGDNIRFMQQLNQMFQYVQIPLKLGEQTVHSELYVYTKKDELKRHPDKISVLLHLDMNNLGALDIHISKEQNSINAQFFCPDDTSADLLETNMELLTTTLNEQGYIFNSKVSNTDNDTATVEDFIKQAALESPANKKPNVSRYTFDIRA